MCDLGFEEANAANKGSCDWIAIGVGSCDVASKLGIQIKLRSPLFPMLARRFLVCDPEYIIHYSNHIAATTIKNGIARLWMLHQCRHRKGKFHHCFAIHHKRLDWINSELVSLHVGVVSSNHVLERIVARPRRRSNHRASA